MLIRKILVVDRLMIKSIDGYIKLYKNKLFIWFTQYYPRGKSNLLSFTQGKKTYEIYVITGKRNKYHYFDISLKEDQE